MDSFLIERLGNIPPVLPNDVIVVPKDSDFSKNPEDIDSYILNRKDFIPPKSLGDNFHSVLKDSIFNDFLSVVFEEDKELFLYIDTLRRLYDVDYYSGDQQSFKLKIDNLARMLDIPLPQEMVNMVGLDKSVLDSEGNIDFLTRRNDFYRNLVKKSYLLKTWKGTYRGYGLPFKLIQRVGSIHLGAIRITNILTSVSNRKYRYLQNPDFFSNLLKGGLYYPNTGDVDSYKSFSSVPKEYIKYDTDVKYDERDPLFPDTFKHTYDEIVPIEAVYRQLFAELSLERLNYLDYSVFLLKNEFLTAVDKLEKEIKRVSDPINVGAQLSLITDLSGTFNNYSQDGDYTHPNIRAKFQTFLTAPEDGVLIDTDILLKWKSPVINNNIIVDEKDVSKNGTLTDVLVVIDASFDALVFNGSSSKIEFSSVSSLIRSYNFWIKKSTAITDDEYILCNNKSTIKLYNTGSESGISYLPDTGLPLGKVNAVFNFTDSLWHMVTILHKSEDNVDIYVDKNLIVSEKSVPINDFSLQGTVGKENFSSLYFLDGKLAEIVIYNRELSTKDIEYLNTYPNGNDKPYGPINYSYVKIGTGGYSDGSADTDIFIDTFNKVEKPRPIDLYTPTATVNIDTAEITTSVNAVFVTPTLHHRDIIASSTEQSVYINGDIKDNQGNSTVTYSNTITTYIDGLSKDIDKGSLDINLYVNSYMPTIQVTSGNGLIISSPEKSSNNLWQFDLISTSRVDGFVRIDFSYKGNNYTSGNISGSSIKNIATSLKGTPLHNFAIATEPNGKSIKIKLAWRIPVIDKKINIKETRSNSGRDFVAIKSLYNFNASKPIFGGTTGIEFEDLGTEGNTYTYKYRLIKPPLLSSGNVLTINSIYKVPVSIADSSEDIANKLSLLSGTPWNIYWRYINDSYLIYFKYLNPYTISNSDYSSSTAIDNTYQEGEENSVIPYVNANPLNFIPLYVIDKYPSLFKNKITALYNNVEDYTNIKDYSVNNLSSTGTNISQGGEYIKGIYGFNYTSNTSLITISPNTPIANFSKFTVALSVKPSVFNTNRVLLATNKNEDIYSEGWGVYWTGSSSSSILDFYYTDSGNSTGHWRVKGIPTFGDGLYHRVVFGWDIDGNIYTLICSVDNVYYPVYKITMPVSLGILNAQPVYIGNNSHQSPLIFSSSFQGSIADIVLWNRLLSVTETIVEKDADLGRLTPLLDANQNPCLTYIDHSSGTLSMRLQYNSLGELQYGDEINKNFVKELMGMDISYSLMKTSELREYTEIGLFNNKDIMLGYATFPPISLDFSKYHLSLNLGIVQES